jgi:hypothetical protein
VQVSAWFYSRRRVSPFLGSMQVIEVEDGRALSLDGRSWELQLLSLEAIPERVWANIGPRPTKRRWFIYGRCDEAGNVRRLPVSREIRDPSNYPALEQLLEALAGRPILPFPAADVHEAWLCDDRGEPLALLATACDEAERDSRKPGGWACLPPTDRGFSSTSGLAGGQGGNAALALNALVSRVGSAGRLQWLQGDAAPVLPWRCDWRGADEQQLLDDYTAYLSPYLLTLQRLDDALRERLEQLAVQQFDLIDYVLPLLPEVLDPGRMEVARVKARLAGK